MNFKKSILKSVSLILSVVLLSSGVGVYAYQGDAFTITNPYQNIDWSNINQYKTALHSHTNASDGSITLKESLERHYETGFDIVAVTDHSTVDYSWIGGKRQFVGKAMSLIGRSKGELDFLGESGAWSNGVSYRIEKRDNTEYIITDTGKEIMKIPYGVEHNALSVNAHVNSWFADFNTSSLSTYRDAIEGVDANGGISVINHPGEYSQARYELYENDAYDFTNPTYKYYIEKFYGLINEFDSCIGIDINSKGDGRTRYDRKLWDILLSKAADKGKTIYAIASSDAHRLNVIDSGSTVILASQKSVSAVKNALINGEFLAQSTCINNYDELCQITNAIKELYGETPIYNELFELTEQYKAKRAEIAASSKDGNVDVKYSAIDEDGYITTQTRPKINSISVDDNENIIKINSENALIVRWISNGKLITTTSSLDGQIDLDDFADEIDGYIRAEVFGEGGVIYTQSFTLNADKANDKQFVYNDYGFFDFSPAILDRYFSLLSRIVKNIF